MVRTVVRDCARKRKLVSALFVIFFIQIVWKYVHQINLNISLQCGSYRDFRYYCYCYHQQQYGPGVDSGSNRNVYQESSWG
jgi:hypothetical protein